MDPGVHSPDAKYPCAVEGNSKTNTVSRAVVDSRGAAMLSKPIVTSQCRRPDSASREDADGEDNIRFPSARLAGSNSTANEVTPVGISGCMELEVMDSASRRDADGEDNIRFPSARFAGSNSTANEVTPVGI